MKNTIKLFLLVLLANTFSYVNAAPPPPPGPGTSTGTQGAPASPIDMYWLLLAAVGLVIIAFYAKKFKKASV